VTGTTPIAARNRTVSDPTTDVLGPVDYAVIEFATDRTTPAPASARELSSLVDTEMIRVIDLVVLRRGDDGTMDVVEYEELRDRSGFVPVDGTLAELLSDRDIEAAAATLAPTASGMIIVFENTWAAPLIATLRAGGERVVAGGRIPTLDLAAALGVDAETE